MAHQLEEGGSTGFGFRRAGITRGLHPVIDDEIHIAVVALV